MAHPITDSEFDAKVLKATTPVLVDFWAPWCGPCKAMLPIVEELSEEFAGKVEIYKINVDENADVSGQYGVMSIPTFMIFKDGEVKETFVGVKSKEDIAIKINALL
jgi:thioredoxin 1